MDPYGTKVKVPYTANGLGIYVALSTMDKYWYPDITREEAGQLLKRCIDEVKLRKYTMLSSLDGPRRWLGTTDGEYRRRPVVQVSHINSLSMPSKLTRTE